ncbi:hypothetical protein PF010_g16750 [Phytophthora fragariae]|uniref:RxLR effector protein n=2 Tax=Phytophthora fragariae TaxID=53985 RepID=A0A6A3EJU4_9STRA|nr:hypothetical protein PF009_g18412 [Phytophthora fragariae]KAE9095322.1 hypothetical protein PF010_g16750 [Phytophthora fragariae]
MRVHYFALAAAILLASSAATSTSTESKLIARRLTDEESVPTQRLLRTHKTSSAAKEEEGEERMNLFGFNIAFIDDIIHNVEAGRTLNGLKKEGTRPDQAFKALNADKVGDNLLASSEFQMLAKYVKMTEKTDPDQALVGAMTANLGGAGFSQKIAEAMKNPNTKELAMKMEAVQISRWLKGDWSPVQIMDTQKLSKASAGLFDSPQFATWSTFLTEYNKKHPKGEITVPEAFTQSYGEEGLLKLLGSIDDGPGATKFKDEYMEAFNMEYSFAKTTMLQTLTKSYGEEKLATMIQAATKVDETKDFAKNLQTSQFNQWMAEAKTPDDIYTKVLKLNSNDSPKADIWRAYYNAYDTENKLFSFKP